MASLITHRRLSLPVLEPDRRRCALHRGEIHTLTMIEDTGKRPAPRVHDRAFVADAIHRFMAKAHFEYWVSRGLLCDGSASSAGAAGSMVAASSGAALAGTAH